MQTQFNDEEIMSFADGNCDAALAARIEVAMQSDQKLADRIKMFAATKPNLKKAFPTLPDTKRDLELAALIRAHASADKIATADNVVSFSSKNKKQASLSFSAWQQAIAASLILVAGLGGGYLFNTNVPQGTNGVGENLLALSNDIGSALDTRASGVTTSVSDGELTVVASFKNSVGDFCREFEIQAATSIKTTAVACRKSAAWQTIVLATQDVKPDSFVPAGGEQAIEFYLQKNGMTEALSENEEQVLLLK